MRLTKGPRVVKRNRGNGGQGVWKVEMLGSPSKVRLLDATADVPEDLGLEQFLERCAPYFEDGCVIDQRYQARLSEGVCVATWRVIVALASAYRKSER